MNSPVLAEIVEGWNPPTDSDSNPDSQPATPTPRQQVLNHLGVTRHLPPAHRLIVVDREALIAGYAAVIAITLGPDGKPDKVDVAKAVEYHGPSWLVPYQDTIRYCHRDNPSRMAIETKAAITTY